MDANSAPIRTFCIKLKISAASVIQSSTVLQCKHIRINDIPQLMAQRWAEVFHNEFFSCFEISAAAVAFCNCKSYFHNCFPISILTSWRFGSVLI